MQSMESALLSVCLAYRIHKTDAAVIATCYTVRNSVNPALRPVFTKIIRCKSPSKWVEVYEKESGL